MKDFASHCLDACTPATGVHTDPLAELFALVSERSEAEEKALDEEAQQIASMIGHNGGPEIVEPFGINAPWFQHAQMAEVEELAKLHAWIEARRRAIEELIQRRAKIRQRCIRRMRRAEGKN